MSQYLSTQEVADRLGVSVFTIRRYIRAGKLRAIKLEGVYRLDRDQLAEFLRSREIGSHPARRSAPEPTPPASRDEDSSESSSSSATSGNDKD